jgi:hypothetical protein
MVAFNTTETHPTDSANATETCRRFCTLLKVAAVELLEDGVLSIWGHARKVFGALDEVEVIL